MRYPDRGATGKPVAHISVTELIQQMQTIEPKASEELDREFLSAWFGVIQDAALDRAEYDAQFLNSIEKNETKMRLNHFLAPDNMTLDAMTQAISREINLVPQDTRRLIEALQTNLKQYGAVQIDEMGFVARSEASNYSILLTSDFFDPVVALPQHEDY